jgi:hypothetical protein
MALLLLLLLLFCVLVRGRLGRRRRRRRHERPHESVFVLGGGLMCYEWRRDGAQRRKYKEAVFAQ